MNEKQIQVRKPRSNKSDARERFRQKIELLLERIPKKIEDAKAGNASSAAGFLMVVQEVLTDVLEEEAKDYEIYRRNRE